MSFLLRHKWIVIVAVLILAVIFATRIRRGALPDKTSEGSINKVGVHSANDEATTLKTPSGFDTSTSEKMPVTLHEAAQEMSQLLTDPQKTPEERVQAVAEVLYLYRQGFGGENPLGHNELVTSALTGTNEKRTAILPADTPAIVNGSLVDPWGTPYWFHALSATHMEVRSAGPDRELFSNDDITIE